MKFLHLPLSTLMLRYYLMMAIVLVAGFTHTWILAWLALPVFISCLLGVRFSWGAMRIHPKGISRIMHHGGKEESRTAA